MPRPSFFILGAPKCGTSAMTHFLRQHPDVAVGAKEVYWFARDFDFPTRPRSEQAYLDRLGSAGGARRLGECSVFYLSSATAPAEIRAYDGEARVIAMIREPVEMIHSLHSQLVYVDSEDVTDFATAIAADEDRARHPAIRRIGYRAVGHYATQLRRWYDALGRDAVHVIVHDDLKADPAATYAAACAFLGVDPAVQVSFEQVNVNKRARNRALQRAIQRPPALVRGAARVLPTQSLRRGVAMTARRLNTRYEPRPPLAGELRAALRAEFAPEVAELSELLGRDLTGWSRGEPIAPATSRR